MIKFISIFNIDSYVIWCDINLRWISRPRRIKGNNSYQMIFIVNLSSFIFHRCKDSILSERFIVIFTVYISFKRFNSSRLFASLRRQQPLARRSETTAFSQQHLPLKITSINRQRVCRVHSAQPLSPSSIPPRPCTFPIAFSPCVYIHTCVHGDMCCVRPQTCTLRF